jgi:hypothetical protein
MTSSHPLAGVRRAAVAVTLSVLSASACSYAGIPTGVDPVASASIVATVPPRIGREGCDRGSPIEKIDGGLEVEGRVAGDREKLWALFATTALRSGEPVDVRWRIGGDRSMRVTLVGPKRSRRSGAAAQTGGLDRVGPARRTVGRGDHVPAGRVLARGRRARAHPGGAVGRGRVRAIGPDRRAARGTIRR